MWCGVEIIVQGLSNLNGEEKTKQVQRLTASNKQQLLSILKVIQKHQEAKKSVYFCFEESVSNIDGW